MNATLETDPYYDKFIKELALNLSTTKFTNGSKSHALSILRTTFNVAKNHVYILSKELDNETYSDSVLIRNAKDFLIKQDAHLKVFVQSDDNGISNQDFCKNLKDAPNVDIFFAKDKKIKELPLNFMVADGHMYRLEPNSSKHEAIGCFNDKVIATELEGIFSRLENINLDSRESRT